MTANSVNKRKTSSVYQEAPLTLSFFALPELINSRLTSSSSYPLLTPIKESPRESEQCVLPDKAKNLERYYGKSEARHVGIEDLRAKGEGDCRVLDSLH